MDFQPWWLIFVPLLFALGWIAARVDFRQMLSETRSLPNSYFKGLNFLLNEEPDRGRASRHYRFFSPCLRSSLESGYLSLPIVSRRIIRNLESFLSDAKNFRRSSMAESHSWMLGSANLSSRDSSRKTGRYCALLLLGSP